MTHRFFFFSNWNDLFLFCRLCWCFGTTYVKVVMRTSGLLLTQKQLLPTSHTITYCKKFHVFIVKTSTNLFNVIIKFLIYFCSQSTNLFLFLFSIFCSSNDDQEVISFNNATLPLYYGLLRLACSYSTQFCKTLSTHANMMWAFEHLIPRANHYAQVNIFCVIITVGR